MAVHHVTVGRARRRAVALPVFIAVLAADAIMAAALLREIAFPLARNLWDGISTLL